MLEIIVFVVSGKARAHFEHVFLRLKVKIKPEIIRMGQKNIHPNLNTGLHVDSDEWDKLITDKQTILIDTRNNYESKIGTFKGSILVNSSNFTEFPKWVKKNEKKGINLHLLLVKPPPLIFGQIFDQVFDQIFGQGFDQGLGEKKHHKD